jgi:hypothetical protein
MQALQRAGSRPFRGRARQWVLGLPLAGACALASAAMGGVLGLRATSPTTIQAGGSVGFAVDVAWTLDASEWSVAGDPPIDPPFYGDVTLRLPGAGGFAEYWQGDSLWAQATSSDPPASVGTDNIGPTGTWTFSFAFPAPGSFEVSVNGTWNIGIDSYEDQFWIVQHWWGMGHSDDGPYGQRTWTQALNSGYYGPLGLTVTVVPEPATCALLLAGLGLLGCAARRGAGGARPGL